MRKAIIAFWNSIIIVLICILLSYNSHINSGDKNDIMIAKNMKHTIKNNMPVSALKNILTKNIANFITK